MAVAFGRATPSLRQPPSRCLDNPVPGNIIFSLNGEHHLLLKVLHFRVDKRNVLLEGISDYYFLQAFRHCSETNDVNLIPSTGATNIPQLVSLLIGWGLEFLVVLDNDGEGIRVADELKSELMVPENRIVFVSKQKECSIEDLFTHGDFNKFVLDETTANKDPEIKNSKFLKNEDPDKVLLAKKFFEKIDKTRKDGKEIELSSPTLNNFQRVFEKIDKEFNQG